MEQRTEQWLAERAGKFTGSRFSDLMARTKTGPSASRANLIVTLAIERINGTCVETFTNSAMQRGIELEAEARSAYETHIGELVDEVAFVPHPTLKFVGVSPDGLVGSDGLVEIKCPASQHKHLAALRSGEHAQEYRWQIQGQLWVTGRTWCDAVSYDPRFPEGLRLAVTRVTRDEPSISELEAACTAAGIEVSGMVNELLSLRIAA